MVNPMIDEFRTVSQTLGVVIDDVFEDIDDAKRRAAELFTCVIGAVGKEGRKYYLRPTQSKDPNIFAYVVIRLKDWGEG